jgi:branched-chain amino acid transport system substrate-binding protein
MRVVSKRHRRALSKTCIALTAVGVLVAACSSSKSSTGGSTGGAGASAGGGSSSGAGSSGGSAANTASDVGVTPTTITLGVHLPLTGPVASSGLAFLPAIQAYAKYVNANGGINGRQLIIDSGDDAYDPATTLSVVRKLVEQDKVFAIFDGFGTPPVQAALPYLTQQKVPDMLAFTGTPQFVIPPQTYHYEGLPNYTAEATNFANYIKQTYPGQKVALLYQHDDFGEAFQTVLVKDLGSSLVAQQSYEDTDTDVMSQTTSLAKSNAAVAMCVCIVPPAVQFIKDSANLNWHPHDLFEYGILNAQTVPLVGAAALEGSVSDTYFPPSQDASDPGVSMMKSILTQYAPATAFNDNTLFAMVLTNIMVDMLKSAGQNPTRASLLKAITENKYTGMWYGAVQITDTNHNALSCREMVKMVSGVVTPFGSPIC